LSFYLLFEDTSESHLFAICLQLRLFNSNEVKDCQIPACDACSTVAAYQTFEK
jgi:hypothetical protein